MPTKEENNPPEEIEVTSASEIQPLKRPNPFLYKWAQKGSHFDIINTPQEATQEKPLKEGQATVITGFPDITMKSVLQGGVPPWGQDHNGILYKITEGIQWTQVGGIATFNPELCNQIGGYPVGAILQTADSSRPWVLWQNTFDGNKNDPDNLDINKAEAQKGWRRYPAIEAEDGASLRYNDVGELKVYTATSQYVLYVSWSTGNDTDHDGSRSSPLKTIDKAIQKSPATGQIVIKILDTDDHYVVGSGDSCVKDINNYTPGKVYTSADKQTEEPKQTIAGSINVGVRNIIIQPYKNPDGNTEGVDGWQELIDLAQRNAGDGWWGYCLTDDDLGKRSLRRPVLYKMWCYNYINTKDGWVTSSTRYCGFDGVQASFSVWFLGCRMVNYNLDTLENTPYYIASAFERVGGNYVYNGCIIDKLCLNDKDSPPKYSMGGTDVTTTTVSFRRSNNFVDSAAKRNGLFVHVNSKITITVTESREKGLASTENAAYIDNNAIDFLSRSTSYTDVTLKIIEKPVPRYAFLDFNLEII